MAPEHAASRTAAASPNRRNPMAILRSSPGVGWRIKHEVGGGNMRKMPQELVPSTLPALHLAGVCQERSVLRVGGPAHPATTKPMRTDEPRPVRLQDYRPPDWLVETVALDVSLDPTATRVRSALTLKPNPQANTPAPLVLDGDGLNLVAIALDGAPLSPER